MIENDQQYWIVRKKIKVLSDDLFNLICQHGGGEAKSAQISSIKTIISELSEEVILYEKKKIGTYEN